MPTQKRDLHKKRSTQKDADVKRCKSLNETQSLTKIVISELNITHIHCTRVCAIIITGLIIDISKYFLIVEHGGYAI